MSFEQCVVCRSCCLRLCYNLFDHPCPFWLIVLCFIYAILLFIHHRRRLFSLHYMRICFRNLSSEYTHIYVNEHIALAPLASNTEIRPQEGFFSVAFLARSVCAACIVMDCNLICASLALPRTCPRVRTTSAPVHWPTPTPASAPAALAPSVGAVRHAPQFALTLPRCSHAAAMRSEEAKRERRCFQTIYFKLL